MLRLPLTTKATLLLVATTAGAVLGLAAMVDHQLRGEMRARAIADQSQALRITASTLAREIPGIDVEVDAAGHVVAVRADALPSFDDHALIDRIGMLTGETATLFLWDEATADFWRETTTIKKADGSRAIGTRLGQNGRVYPVVTAGDTYRGEATILGVDYYTIYEPVLDGAGDVVGIVYAGVKAAETAAVLAEARWAIAQATLLVLAAGLVLGVVAFRWMLRPLTRLGVVIRETAAGNRNVEVPFTQRPDEIGDLARALAALREQEERAQRVRDEARSDALRQLLGVSIQSNETMVVMARLIHDVGASTAQVHTMASAVEELRASIGEIAATSETASQSATVCRTDAAHGVDDAADATKAMGTVASSVAQVQGAVEQLAEASSQIGAIAGQIEEIASQTNLLALNATIEAARAGDAGRGFAVVASEVKALAEQTSRATEDIRARIEGVVGSIAEITHAMQGSTTSVGEGQRVVAEMTDSLGTIADRVGGMSEGMTQLAAAITEQSAATDEIARSASAVSTTTQRCNEDLGGAIHVLENLADSLGEDLSRFADLGDAALVRVAQNDHCVFKKKIIDVLIGRTQMNPDALPDHHMCRLGKWADSVPAWIRELPAFTKLGAPHERVHQAGRQVLVAAAAGRMEEALDRFQALDEASKSVLSALDELAVAIESQPLAA